MPIAVSCSSCKAKFTVSDKFAGKQGPCPKCKAPITIPKLETKPAAPSAAPGKPGAPAGKPGSPAAKPGAPAAGAKAAPPPMPEVVIHAPETDAPKDSTGRPVTKPISRRETKFEVVPAVIISASVLVTLAVAWIMCAQLQQNLILRAVGLLLVSPPIAVAGYTFLRDDELEPYRGRWLWIRGAICGLVYLGMWGAYLFLPADATAEAWNWILVGPPFFVVGAGAAYATFDLEFGNGFFHYCFYVLATLLLGAAAGLAMPWAAIAS